MALTSNKRKNIIKIAMFAVYIVVLAVLIRYVMANEAVLHKLKNADLALIMIGVSTTVCSVVLTGAMDVTCAKAYGIGIRLRESVIFSFIASAVNTVMPLQLGSAIKAVYYKRKSALSYSKFVSIMAGTMVLNVVITLACALLTVVFVLSDHSDMRASIVFMGVAIICISAGLVFLNGFRTFILRVVPFKKYTLPILNGYYDLMLNKRTVMLCIANILACNILGGIRFFAILSMLGATDNYLLSLMYYCITSASGMIPILPGNIGISEGIIGVIHSAMNAEFSIGVTLVLINRIYYYLVTIVGTVLFSVPAWMLYKGSERDGYLDDTTK